MGLTPHTHFIILLRSCGRLPRGSTAATHISLYMVIRFRAINFHRRKIHSFNVFFRHGGSEMCVLGHVMILVVDGAAAAAQLKPFLSVFVHGEAIIYRVSRFHQPIPVPFANAIEMVDVLEARLWSSPQVDGQCSIKMDILFYWFHLNFSAFFCCFPFFFIFYFFSMFLYFCLVRSAFFFRVDNFTLENDLCEYAHLSFLKKIWRHSPQYKK